MSKKDYEKGMNRNIMLICFGIIIGLLIVMILSFFGGYYIKNGQISFSKEPVVPTVLSNDGTLTLQGTPPLLEYCAIKHDCPRKSDDLLGALKKKTGAGK